MWLDFRLIELFRIDSSSKFIQQKYVNLRAIKQYHKSYELVFALFGLNKQPR